MDDEVWRVPTRRGRLKRQHEVSAASSSQTAPFLRRRRAEDIAAERVRIEKEVRDNDDSGATWAVCAARCAGSASSSNTGVTSSSRPPQALAATADVDCDVVARVSYAARNIREDDGRRQEGGSKKDAFLGTAPPPHQVAPRWAKQRGQEMSSQPAKAISSPMLLPFQRYAPTQLSEMVGVGRGVSRLRQWAAALRASPQRGRETIEQEAALILGPPGTGKSIMARLMLKSLGYAIVEFNLSNECDLREALSKLTPRDVSGAEVAVVVDELYELVELQPAVTAARCSVPVVCTSNRKPKASVFATTIRLYPLNRANSIELSRSVIRKVPTFTATHEERDFREMVEACAGDARMITQNAALSASGLTRTVKDEDASCFDQCRAVLNGRVVDDLSAYAVLLLHENIEQLGLSLEGTASWMRALTTADSTPFNTSGPRWGIKLAQFRARAEIDKKRSPAAAYVQLSSVAYFQKRLSIVQALDDAARDRSRMVEGGCRLPPIAMAQLLYGKKRRR